jgi:AraC family transcriptional regulator, transcriptional activator of pobA
MSNKEVTNHFPRKANYVNTADFKKFGNESHLKETPDDSYFQIHHTTKMARLYGPKLPHIKYPYYYVGIIKKGKFKVSVGLTEFEPKPYTIWFAAPFQIYSCEDISKNSSAYYMNFSPSFLLNEFANKKLLHQLPFYSLSNKPYISLSKKEGEYLLNAFELINREYEGNNSSRDELIRLKTIEVLLLSERIFNNNNKIKTVNSVTTELVFKFKVLIEDNFKRHLSASDYAAMLSVHPNYLNRAIKTQTGKTSTELINERIKLEAISLLVYTHLSVSEIAYQLGFEEVSHFSKFFKKLTTVSPGQYKKMVKV